MEHKRRRFFKTVSDRRERLERIAAATQPAATIEGQVQRLRDRRAEARGEPAPGTVIDEDDVAEADALEPNEDAQAAETVLEQSDRRRRRGRPLTLKPSHRHPPASSDTRGASWWTTVDRERFSQAAAQERPRMEKSGVAKSVVGRINE